MADTCPGKPPAPTVPQDPRSGTCSAPASPASLELSITPSPGAGQWAEAQSRQGGSAGSRQPALRVSASVLLSLRPPGLRWSSDSPVSPHTVPGAPSLLLGFTGPDQASADFFQRARLAAFSGGGRRPAQPGEMGPGAAPQALSPWESDLIVGESLLSGLPGTADGLAVCTGIPEVLGLACRLLAAFPAQRLCCSGRRLDAV